MTTTHAPRPRINHSACYHHKGDLERAAQDGKMCIEKDPDFVKGTCAHVYGCICVCGWGWGDACHAVAVAVFITTTITDTGQSDTSFPPHT
jgi:hypothetical protein